MITQKRLSDKSELADQMAQLRQFVHDAAFADCWLAPITDRGELATTEAMTLAGRDEATPTESSSAASPCEEPVPDGDSPRQTASAADKAQPGQRPTSERHRRLVRRHAKRASNRTMLSLPLPQYLALARRAAHSARHEWAEAPAAGDDLRDASPTHWRGSVDLFTAWLRASLSSAAELSVVVRQALGLSAARGDPLPMINGN